MAFDLLATLFVAGFAGAFTWLVFRAIRRRPPRVLIPLVVGAVMLSYTVWNAYSWAWRTAEALPQGVEVIEKIPKTIFWQPWTFLFPQVDRMVAIDRVQVRSNERFPGYTLVELVLIERFIPARRALILIDCRNGRRADVSERLTALGDALPPDKAWAPMRRDSSLFRAVCETAVKASG